MANWDYWGLTGIYFHVNNLSWAGLFISHVRHPGLLDRPDGDYTNLPSSVFMDINGLIPNSPH